VVLALYVFFEIVVINYRPTLIAGCLEASYPSSTTLLVMCIMPTAMMQLYTRIQNIIFRQWILLIMALFVVVMVIGRLLSGVHWITDIIGGALLSAAMVFLYYAISDLVTKNGETHTPF
jgi:undecaprenyl-diphosphatase